MLPNSFSKFSAVMAGLSAAVALAYSITFGVYVQDGTEWAQRASSGLLMAGGLVGLPVIVALYLRLRPVDEGFALVGLALATASAFGSVLHGAHDIAVFANPEAAGGGLTDQPSFTDPRGFATFGLFGLGLLVLAVLAGRAGFGRTVSRVGVASAVLVIVVYVGRVTVLDPKEWWNATAAVLSGLVGVPLWNVLVARRLWRDAGRPAVQPNAPAARSSAMAVAS